ncbi:MAG: esterase-like activity of phytase family protein, partial [Cyanobacteriota bacterium]|nr:esterase-like activity of phytase family protein [Cyanobacteriota bacterium]
LELDNLEGMTLGPRFPDGAESLWLISDNNFRQDQVIQILVFRLRA